MRLIRKDKIQQPFVAPLGEKIYEMIGRPQELGGTTNHSFVHVVVPAGSRSPRHFHKVSEETYYVLSGSAAMEVDGNEFPLVAGDALLIMPREWHQIKNDSTDELHFITVSAPAWVPTDTYTEQAGKKGS
jgi:mannose-6-phosphate isomerase-like protein (cupin superfamily)